MTAPALIPVFPAAAILGQDDMMQALLWNAVNPRIGGVLVRGEKGTAKSTAVRGIAALLPYVEVLEACPFECGPEDENHQCAQCGLCEPPRPVVRSQVKVITLPLNATEDRVAGGIDFDRAIRTGRRVVQPGLLARAHRGFLYVDEVNLLDDHLVDAVLDAASSGENRIEREGISFSHPSRFVLVGTMNPEEGELRPQLLDRFGLCVEIEAISDRDQRVALMIQREMFDLDPEAYINRFGHESEILSRRIEIAREILGRVRLSGRLRSLIGEMCQEALVAGHRADLVIEQAANAVAALDGRTETTAEDIVRVAPLALRHRRREGAPPPPPPQEQQPAQAPPPQEENPPDPDHEHEQPDQKPPEETQGAENDSTESAPEPPDAGDEAQSEPREDVLEKVFEVGETFKVKRLTTPKDRTFRRGSGRRSRTRVSGKQGRYVKCTMPRGTRDVALDATLRAASPYQTRRKNTAGLAVVLRPEDIREKVRERRMGNFLLFVVDASGSMGARGRMAATKGAVMSLLLDAYQKRDKVAMISFCKSEARLNLPPTSSVELASRMLAELPVGGRTPLSAALAKSHEVLRAYLVRDPSSRPIVMLITDGRSNVSIGGGKPLDETLSLARKLALDSRVRFIVVDTEDHGIVHFGLARRLAEALNAEHLRDNDLKADTLIDIVKGESV
jgi:magnesium chelatase subunit D